MQRLAGGIANQEEELIGGAWSHWAWGCLHDAFFNASWAWHAQVDPGRTQEKGILRRCPDAHHNHHPWLEDAWPDKLRRQSHSNLAWLHQAHNSGEENDDINRASRRGRSRRPKLAGLRLRPGLLRRLWRGLLRPGLGCGLWRRPGLWIVYWGLAEGRASRRTTWIGWEEAWWLRAECAGTRHCSRGRRGALRSQCCPTTQAEVFVRLSEFVAGWASNPTRLSLALRELCLVIGRWL